MNELRAMIRRSSGRFFRVEFVKRDGSRRTMIARVGVRKGVTGKGLAFKPEEHNLMVVFDIQRNAFRMLNLATLLSFQCGATKWQVAA